MIHYINCPSYSSLFFALHLKNKGKKVVVITINNSVKKYCKVVDISYVSIPTPQISIRAPHKVCEFKRKTDSIFQNIRINKNDRFYLLDNCYTIEGFYLAKKFSQKCSVFYQCLYKHILPYRRTLWNLYGLKKNILRKIINLVLGISLVFKDVDKKPIFGINTKFLDENNIKRLNLHMDLQKLKSEAMNNNSVRLAKYDTMIVDEGLLLHASCIEKNSVIKLYKTLFSYNFNFVIKEHPNFKNPKSFFINYPKYPDYIPVEFLFNNIKKNIISISCSSLPTATKLNKVRVISLLELVEWVNESYKYKIRKILSGESNNKILFVKSLDELKSLL